MISIKQIHLHKNMIVDLPSAIHKLWPKIEEFSLDWFSYIIPFVGRIIKSKEDEVHTKKG